MKKHVLIFLFLILPFGGYLSFSQTLVPYSGSNSVACGTNVTLQDHAGAGSYSNYANGYTVLNAAASAVININGSYSTEFGYDYIRIYAGSGTGGALLATYHGSGTINYTGSAGQTLTVSFYSDAMVTSTGFSLAVTYSGSCVAPYKATFLSMNTGSSTWCAGETRNVTVTIRNDGSATWVDGGVPDVNIGVKWNAGGGNWNDYYVRVNAGNLAPGNTATYTLPLTASNNAGAGYTTLLSPGSNNITFDVVKEGDCWFGSNIGSCGPGNTVSTSPAQTIVCCTPSAPVSLSGVNTGQTTANLSWAAGATVGSPTVTYNWYVGTNAGGNCPTAGTATFGFTGSMQSWVVPAGVTSATIEAWGAQGGSSGANAGGLGARMKGTFAVTPGQTLKILVGGQGIAGTSGGGGGGSFVTDISNNPLVIAGGGGGGYYSTYSYGSANMHGTTSTSGLSGMNGYNNTVAGAGGAGPSGGGLQAGYPNSGAAGGGLSGNGGSWTSPGAQGGNSFVNNGAGGAAAGSGGTGGYGGGGGGDWWSWTGGGGGGGYGGGGSGAYYGCGGGGGSYNGGSSPNNTAGVQSGNGYVTITYTGGGSAVASGSTTGTSASATGLTCGTTYYLSVYATTSCNSTSSACATSAAFTTASCCVVPSISAQPANTTICTGSTAALSVTASGTAPLTYQWQSMASNCATPTNVGTNSPNYTTASLTTGTYYYRCIVTNACGSSTSNCAVVTVNAASVLGTVSNAGPFDFCSATGDWTTSGPISVSGHTGTVTWDRGASNGTWNTGWVTGTSPSYTTFPSKVAASDANYDRIRWSVTNGVCPATGYSTPILLRNHYTADPSSLTANTTVTCLGSTSTLTATFPTSISILGTVEFSTTCGGSPFATVTPGNNVTAVTATVVPVSGPNTYYARYNPGTGTGCTPSGCASVNITANLAPTLPANNTSAQTICSNSTAALTGNNPVIGTGIWSIISGPSTSSAQIADVYDNTTVFTPTGGAGNYVIRWTIDNLPCSSEIDDATVVVVGAPTAANAGANQTMCATGTLVLAANNPTVGTGVWDILSGPSTNTSQLSSTTAYNATFDPSSSGGGTYILEWTTSSSAPCAATTSTMSITSNPAPTTSAAGPAQTICSNGTATLAANNPTIGTGQWSVTSGPSTSSAQFGNVLVRNTLFTPAGGAGSYVLTWTISNAPCAASASNVTITVNAAPTTSNAGPAQNICITTGSATLAANNPTVGTGVWNVVSGPSTSSAQFSNTGAYNAVFTPAGGAGTYVLRWSISSTAPCVASTSNVTITFNSTSVLGTVSDAGPIDFCSPSGNWSSDPISVSGHNGTVTWDRGSSNGSWTTGWATGTSPNYTGIPKKVAVSDANPDRIRWSVQNGACPATGYSATILLRNHTNETPSSITSNPASACATAATTATLTATFSSPTNILGTVEFSTSCGGAPFATVAGNGSTSVSTTFTTPSSSTTYFARYNPGTGTGCSATGCVNTLVTADIPPVLGAVSNSGPIDFCSATGDWSSDAISIAGETGIVWWQYGSSNGTWSADWVSGLSPTYTTFPKKVASSDGNTDRVRWYVKSTNGGCTPTAFSSAILIKNHYNEDPSGLTSNINNICSGVAGTLTATFPSATDILGTVEFSTSCGGTPFATVAGNGTTSVATSFTAPSSTTTFFARYNPGTGTGCSPGGCKSTVVTVLPPIPATPGIISGTVAQCPSVTGLVYSITPVANATSYNWAVPTGWVITSGSGTNAITVTSGILGQNGNITVTATNSCGTSAASVLAVNCNGCLPAPSQMVFPTNANVFMTISNGAILTVGNPSPAAINNAGYNGAYKSWIISEGQGNAIQWNDITPGTYVVPFGYNTTDYIPFTFTKTSAGSSTLNVSTWGTPSNNKIGSVWCNATNVAAVNNMWSAAIAADASIPSVIDRWWAINTSATTTANVTFSYRDDENATTSNPTGQFGAQHWNGTTWDAPVGSGTGIAPGTGVGSVTVPAISDFSPWVLALTDIPLPVTWLDVTAECNYGDVTVKWSTASEQNSDYFTVERSLDGTNFTDLATVLAAGNSSTIKNYSWLDQEPYSGTSFYRVRETDFNGSFMYSGTLVVNGCSNDDVNIFGNGNGVMVSINSETEGQYAFEIYDMLGRKLFNELKAVSAGSNHFKLTPQNVASAIYIVKVYNNNNSVTKKIFIRKQE